MEIDASTPALVVAVSGHVVASAESMVAGKGPGGPARRD